MVDDDRGRAGDGDLGEELDVFTGDPVDALFDVDSSGDDRDDLELTDADLTDSGRIELLRCRVRGAG